MLQLDVSVQLEAAVAAAAVSVVISEHVCWCITQLVIAANRAVNHGC